MRLIGYFVGAAAVMTLGGCGSSAQNSTIANPSSAPTAPTVDVAPTAPGETEATPTPAPVSTTGRLRVTQHQTACCYTEGQVSFLNVREAAGPTVQERKFQRIDDIEPVIDVQLPAGAYVVESYQRPCNANCDNLDAKTDECSAVVEIGPGDEHFLTVEFAPTESCAITSTDEPLASPVPDEFALRPEYASCGTDFALADSRDTTIGRARQCFIDANDAHTAAELAAYEAGANPDSPDFFVYRSNADGSVDVFRPNLGRPGDGPWRRFTCAELVHDQGRGFTLADCTAPVVLHAPGVPVAG